jgi:hypothetical protein
MKHREMRPGEYIARLPRIEDIDSSLVAFRAEKGIRKTLEAASLTTDKETAKALIALSSHYSGQQATKTLKKRQA